MAELKLNVNGRVRQVQAAQDEPLLWVLRNKLGLTGTKYGCGEGQCGACTVLLDGRPTRSCLTPAVAVAGAKITTIEGLVGEGAIVAGAGGVSGRGGVPVCVLHVGDGAGGDGAAGGEAASVGGRDCGGDERQYVPVRDVSADCGGGTARVAERGEEGGCPCPWMN